MQHLIGIIISPSATFRELPQKKPWIGAMIIITAATIATRLVSVPSKTTLPVPFRSPLFFTFATLPLFIALAFISWAVFSLLTYGIAKVFDGKGELADTFIVLAYSETPLLFSVLLLPVSILRLYALPPELLIASYWLVGSFQFALYIWSLILIVFGLREVHSISYPRAAGAACLPGCGCLIVIFSLIALLAALGILTTTSFLTP